MSRWTTLGAAALAQEIRSGRVTARTVVQAHLAALERHNPALNAVVLVDAEGALATADAVDHALAAGGDVGPLAGVPFTVKDTLETAGLRTTAGSPMYAHHVPHRDAHVVAQLKAAGAILLGKTNTPPLAADVQTFGPLLGRASNPHDVTRTPGGSTGGGAAAVAVGLSPLEVGSDHGGSLRIPAHCCGVFAFKPTEHALSLDGHLHGWPAGHHHQRALVCVGFLARTVEDLALAFDVCGPSHVLIAESARPRLAAYDVATGFPPISRAVAEVLRDVLARLTTAADVTTGAPAAWDWQAAWQTWGTIMAHDTFAPWNAAARAWLAGLGGVVLPSADPVLRHAREVQDRLRAAVDVLLLEQDAWVVPVMGVEAFVHQPTGAPIPVDGGLLDYWLATAAFTAPLSLTGHPVVVMPVGRTVAGLPVGLQLVGRRGGDHALLDLAARLAPTLARFYGPAA